MEGAGRRQTVTPAELARKTGTLERYLREWLSSQAASGYVDYDAATGRFTLTPEQAAIFADDDSPFLSTGGFYTLAAVYADEPKLETAFRTGAGVAWADRSNCLFCGVERFFPAGLPRPSIAEWLPALDGVVKKLRARGPGRRHRLRPRVVDHHHGGALPQVELHRLRHP